MSVIKSNKLNDLANVLFENIINDEDFFHTKEVLVSSRKMESFLKSYFLKENDGILMNVKFDTLNNGLLSFFNTDKKIADISEMTLAIIYYLSNNKIKELDDYLNDSNNTIRGIKIYDVSTSLAKLFFDYESGYRIDELDEYKRKIYDNMIKLLNENNLDTLYHIYKTTGIKVDKDFSIFGIVKYTKLEEEIINKYKQFNNINEYLLELDPTDYSKEIEIIKAPSKLREIECIHSKICDLLLNTNCNYSDILVVGSNLSDYETTISRVFNQDNVDYPNIPYYIDASKQKDNEVLNGLKRLKNIVDKGYFTRLDLINLAQNKIIQYIREITDEDVQNFADTIISINTHRGIGKNTDEFRVDDWVYAKNRLLLSKITDSSGDDDLDKLNIDGRDYLPYTRIGMDNNAIVKFISLVDDVVNLINIYNNIKIIDKGNIIQFKEAIDRFFSIKEDDEIEVNSYYKKASQMLDMIIFNNYENININTILYLLISCAERTTRNRGELYSSGISFTSFDINNVLAAKYVFFLNCDSKNLPVKKNKNTFANSTDLINYDDEENAFNLYYQNSKYFYVSYVYKDLKTGEDYYLSNFIKDVFKKQNKALKEEDLEAISIDETRDWSELYTKKEFINKDFRNGLLIGNVGTNETNNNELINVVDTTITTSQMAKYLYEPLEYKANRLFGYGDKTNENLKDEFEIFDVNNLEEMSIFKTILERLLILPDISVKNIIVLNEEDEEYTEEKYEKYVNDVFKIIEDYVPNYELSKYGELNIPEMYKKMAYFYAYNEYMNYLKLIEAIEYEDDIDDEFDPDEIRDEENEEDKEIINADYRFSFDDFINYLKSSEIDLDIPNRPQIVLEYSFLMLKFQRMIIELLIDDIRKKMNLRKMLPDINETWNEKTFYDIYERSNFLLEYIKTIPGDINYSFINDLRIEKDNKEWVLLNNRKVFRVISDEKRTYIMPKDLSNLSNKDLLELYVISLMDIAALNDDCDYSIDLIFEKNGKIKTNNYHLKGYVEAVSLLNEIYENMNDYSNNKFLPYSLIERTRFQTLDDLVSSMYAPNSIFWGYFSDKKLFEYEKELGYSEKDFLIEIDDMICKHIKIIKFLQNENGDDSNGE